jgi:hypothetical protein
VSLHFKLNKQYISESYCRVRSWRSCFIVVVLIPIQLKQILQYAAQEGVVITPFCLPIFHKSPNHSTMKKNRILSLYLVGSEISYGKVNSEIEYSKKIDYLGKSSYLAKLKKIQNLFKIMRECKISPNSSFKQSTSNKTFANTRHFFCGYTTPVCA